MPEKRKPRGIPLRPIGEWDKRIARAAKVLGVPATVFAREAMLLRADAILAGERTLTARERDRPCTTCLVRGGQPCVTTEGLVAPEPHPER